MLTIADVVGVREVVGATEVVTDESVLLVGTMAEDPPPSVESGTNTPPLVEVGPDRTDGLLEDPTALEAATVRTDEDAGVLADTDTGDNGDESGVTEVGKLLPVPIGALMATVVGRGEGDGALFLTVASNHEDNQRSYAWYSCFSSLIEAGVSVGLVVLSQACIHPRKAAVSCWSSCISFKGTSTVPAVCLRLLAARWAASWWDTLA